MEGSFIKEKMIATRVEMDRILRSYRRMEKALRASRSCFSADYADLDETAVQAEMYSLRSMVLSLDDPRERIVVYNYYIKGLTLEDCAHLIGVSPRSVCRLKGRGLENLLIKAQKR